MSYDVYIKIEGIEGESNDAKHIGWIEVTSFGLAISQDISATASSAGGAIAERADFSELPFQSCSTNRLHCWHLHARMGPISTKGVH